jgi:hypothetical protein
MEQLITISEDGDNAESVSSVYTDSSVKKRSASSKIIKRKKKKKGEKKGKPKKIKERFWEEKTVGKPKGSKSEANFEYTTAVKKRSSWKPLVVPKVAAKRTTGKNEPKDLLQKIRMSMFTSSRTSSSSSLTKDQRLSQISSSKNQQSSRFSRTSSILPKNQRSSSSLLRDRRSTRFSEGLKENLSDLGFDKNDDNFEKIFNRSSSISVGKEDDIMQILNELEEYEISLETERHKFEEERLQMDLQKQLHYDIVSVYQEEVKDLKQKVADQSSLLSKKKEADTDSSFKNMITQMSVLKDKIKRQELIIASLHKSKSKKQSNALRTDFDGTITQVAFDISRDSFDSDDDIAPTPLATNASDFTVLSMKAQGERLRLHGTLNEYKLIIKQQREEINALQEKLDLIDNNHGIKKMDDYIKALEVEKKYFETELQKANNNARKSFKRPSSDNGKTLGFMGFWNSNNSKKSEGTSNKSAKSIDSFEVVGDLEGRGVSKSNYGILQTYAINESQSKKMQANAKQGIVFGSELSMESTDHHNNSAYSKLNKMLESL